MASFLVRVFCAMTELTDRGMTGPAEGQRVLRGDDLLYLWSFPTGHLQL
jgi:hypothetical protein